MAILKQEIHKIIKGSLMETEDWWRLCHDTENGTFYIEHEWSHVDPYNLNRPANSGTTIHPADTWYGHGSDKIEEAKAKLIEQARQL